MSENFSPPGGGDGPRPPSSGPGGPPTGPGGRPMRPKGKYAPRRKVCQFCVEKIDYIDFKDLMRLRRFLSERGKIEPGRKTGTCAKHQRRLSTALKRARHLALLPYTADHIRVAGGMVQPVPGQPMPAERPFPPRDSFGPQGSQPGGSRQQSSDGPGMSSNAPPAPVAAAPAALESVEDAAVEAPAVAASPTPAPTAADESTADERAGDATP